MERERERERERGRPMVRDGPAQEALSGAEGHQAESGLPKRPRAPLSHRELSYSHSLHLSSLGDPGLHGLGELSPQLGEDPLSLCSVPQGQDSGSGRNCWREPRSGSNSIRFAPSDLFWAHIVPDSADTEQKHKQARVPGGQVQCTPGVATQIKSPRLVSAYYVSGAVPVAFQALSQSIDGCYISPLNRLVK